MLTQVNIAKSSNIYFDGKVTSRVIDFGDNKARTIGVMQTGQYRFNTEKAEVMTILSGVVNVRLAGEESAAQYQADQTFNVPAGSYFDIEVVEVADYVCEYIG